jgi:hypothetical protein
MKITTSAELIVYIQNNFDSLTNEDYIRLISTTLKVYPFEKPKNVSESIRMITEMSNIPIEVRPLFS